MFYLRYLCLFPYSGANRYCVVFLFFLVLCTVLQVSLDCPFMIVPLVFSNVYLLDFIRKSYFKMLVNNLHNLFSF